MADLIDFEAIFGDDPIPAKLARIPVSALEAITELIMPIAHQRAKVMDSAYRHTYIEAQQDLVRQIAEIIQREMAEVPELIRKELERDV